MYVDKLEKLKRYVLEEPRRFNQSYWLFSKHSITVQTFKPPCGFVGCLAGNTCLMEGLVPVQRTDIIMLDEVMEKGGLQIFDVEWKATEILGLSRQQAARLFSGWCNHWPEQAADQYRTADRQLTLMIKTHTLTEPVLISLLTQRAEAAAMAIDAMIEEGKNETKPVL